MEGARAPADRPGPPAAAGTLAAIRCVALGPTVAAHRYNTKAAGHGAGGGGGAQESSKPAPAETA